MAMSDAQQWPSNDARQQQQQQQQQRDEHHEQMQRAFGKDFDSTQHSQLLDVYRRMPCFVLF
jgi:hypothetical protein